MGTVILEWLDEAVHKLAMPSCDTMKQRFTAWWMFHPATL